MGMMSRDGSSQATDADLNTDGIGTSMVPQSTTDSDPNYETPTTLTDTMENFPFVKNPALDRQAFDISQYPSVASNFQGYLAGHRVQCTYFRQLNDQGDIRTNIVDYPNERHILHTSYQRIINFELTLPEPWSFEYDATNAQSSVTGTAYTYPGLNPQIGDVFLIPAGDNKVGMFKVSTIQPLSWRNQRVYQIGYFFFSIPDQGNYDIFLKATVQTVYFDKVNFLGGTTSLFEEDLYRNILKMRQMRDVLARYYVRQFFAPDMNSFIRPDNLYDPYVVKYMASKCSYQVVKSRPRQLWAKVDLTWSRTLWARLIEWDNSSVSDLFSYTSTSDFIGTTADVGITDLQGYDYLTVSNQSSYGGVALPDYVFSQNFYTSNATAMTAFEQLVYATIKTRQLLDTSSFIGTYLDTYQSLSPMDQYYQIPLYLFLIDVALRSVNRQVA